MTANRTKIQIGFGSALTETSSLYFLIAVIAPNIVRGHPEAGLATDNSHAPSRIDEIGTI
jgi:hypothetical protein